MVPTRHPKIGIWNNIPMDREKLRRGIKELLDTTNKHNHSQITEKIKNLVPEYIGDNNTTSQ